MLRQCRLSCDHCDGAPSIVFMEQSALGWVFVVDEGGMRHLRFDQWEGDDQSSVATPLNPRATPMEYIRFASLLGTGFGPPSPARVLAIGLGGGGFVSLAHAALPSAVVEAVELDEVVVRVAREHFGLRQAEAAPGHRLRISVGDGAAFLEQRPRETYDSIFVDCYQAGVPSDRSDIPSHIVSRAFFALLRAKLRPGGLAVLNVAEDDPALELAMVANFSVAFADETKAAPRAPPLQQWQRRRLVRLLAAMKAADASPDSAAVHAWADTLAEMLAEGDASGAGDEDRRWAGLLAWLASRLAPFRGSSATLSRVAVQAKPQAEQTGEPVCYYLNAAELERVLEAEEPAGQKEQEGCDLPTSERGCLALLTPNSGNLLLVGQMRN